MHKRAEDILTDFDINIDRWPDTKMQIIKAMKEYAKQACEQQRVNCMRAFGDGNLEAWETNTIVEAKIPELS